MSNIKEIKRLRGDVACYVAQASAPIDAEIGQKDHLWMETNEISVRVFLIPLNSHGGNFYLVAAFSAAGRL